MNLLQLRSEVLAHGFDPVQYGARVNNYLNDAAYLIARRVDYYVNEAVLQIATTAGNNTYQLLPGGIAGSAGTELSEATPIARIKSVFDNDRRVELAAVSERQIDRSPNTQGAPLYYAVLYAGNLELYPTPDGVYNIRVRAWTLPPKLVNDTDVPKMPEDWHRLLWYYAVAECYNSDDDLGTGGQWMQRFTEGLAEFAADQKFPSTDGPTQAADMWGGDDSLGSSNMWTRYPFGA